MTCDLLVRQDQQALLANEPAQQASLIGLAGDLVAACAKLDRAATVARLARSPHGRALLART